MLIKDVYEWLETAGQEPSESKVDLAISLIEEELQELKDAWAKGDRVAFLDAVIDLYWVVTNAPFFAGEPLEEVNNWIEKVSISNWSKFCKNEQEAIDTCQAYQIGSHPDKPQILVPCYYEQHGVWWVVKRTDGKILKSINYLPVNNIKNG